MAFKHIISERIDGVGVITLHRPHRPEKLNALSFELMQELDQELTRIASDEEVKSVILTGRKG